MAGASFKFAEEKKKARIEIIPLIDVIFFLLATFVLFTLSLDKIQSLPVQLPTSSVSQKQDNDQTVTLQVSDEGTYYWNGASITLDELTPRLQNYVATDTNPKVMITGDSKALFGPAVIALDMVRKAGIQQVSIETDHVTPTGIHY